MAMGDPEIREAAARGDAEGFIDAVLAQGIRPNYTAEIGGLVATEIAAYFSAFVVSWVVASYTVVFVVSVVVLIGVSGAAEELLTVEHHRNMLTQLAEHLGDPRFAQHVRTVSMDRIIREYVELHRSALEQSRQGSPGEG